MNIAKKAAKLLSQLGDTPEEIAVMLKGSGYKGDKNEPITCPCGNCLRDHLQVKGIIKVYNENICYVDNYNEVNEGITNTVSNFIYNFDKGDYPELVTKYADEE